ncbi:MAG TPA: lysophospholipid acyltransferase family protein [Vicinamibacterales bacterium]|nr:lysophospholipid acyltransferase family protein [Vicinamibacterales bacterium]
MSDVRLSRAQRLQAAIIAAVASPLIGLLCRTLTWQVSGPAGCSEILTVAPPPILAFWHGRILGGLGYFRDRDIVVITSQNFDGEWIARIIRRFGYGSARGSSSRGGARALVQMRRELAAGRPVAFTLDGPRGPSRVAQPGAVWLAGATGSPLLPFHLEAARHWSLRSWDRTQVPKPFTRLALAIGDPIRVVSTAPGEVESKRRQLEDTLRDLERKTLDMLRSNTTVPDDTAAGSSTIPPGTARPSR